MPNLRKLTLAAHIVSSGGWIGAVLAYLALAVGGLTTDNVQLMGSSYQAMEVIALFVIVPLSFATLLTGLVEALTKRWGLVQHWWVVAKFALTTGAIVILLVHMPTISQMSNLGTQPTLTTTDFLMLRTQLVVHAAGALMVLLAAALLSVYKPWGMTPYGQRKLEQRHEVSVVKQRIKPETNIDISYTPTAPTPRWAKVVAAHAILLGLVFVVIHLALGGGPKH